MASPLPGLIDSAFSVTYSCCLFLIIFVLVVPRDPPCLSWFLFIVLVVYGFSFASFEWFCVSVCLFLLIPSSSFLLFLSFLSIPIFPPFAPSFHSSLSPSFPFLCPFFPTPLQSLLFISSSFPRSCFFSSPLFLRCLVFLPPIPSFCNFFYVVLDLVRVFQWLIPVDSSWLRLLWFCRHLLFSGSFKSQWYRVMP